MSTNIGIQVSMAQSVSSHRVSDCLIVLASVLHVHVCNTDMHVRLSLEVRETVTVCNSKINTIMIIV